MDQFTAAPTNLATTHASELFRLALEAAPTGMLMIDRLGRITLVNAQIERLFGYNRHDLIGSPLERLVPDRYKSRHSAFRDSFFQAPQVRAMGVGRDLFGLRNDGTEMPVEIGLTPVVTPDGDFVLSSIVDITERKRSEELFRLALEAAPTGMMMVNSAGLITLVNAEIETLFGYTRRDLIGMPVENLVPERFRQKHPAFRTLFCSAPQARAMGAGRDLYGLRKDGSEVPIEIGLNPLHTPEGLFILSSIVDITERRRAMVQLQERTDDLTASLKERDVLLQEVHHRVKNNLQVISSLISMQMRKKDSGSPQVVLAECKRRVDAISLIHEKLYQSRDYSHVPFSDYVRSLAASIVHATDATGSGIELDIQCDNVSLPVDKAISCGLILNELITNALKHAFPDGEGGRLHVGLHSLDHGLVRLVVQDSGVGTREIDRATTGSLGLQLVNLLTEQLDGHLTTEVAGGTCVTVEFSSTGQKE